MARGSSRLGSRRSFAVKVTMPKPRNAKNVRATLEKMSRSGGYPDGASSDGVHVRDGDHREHREDADDDEDDHALRAGNKRRAQMLTPTMMSTMRAANTLAHTLLSLANMALA